MTSTGIQLRKILRCQAKPSQVKLWFATTARHDCTLHRTSMEGWLMTDLTPPVWETLTCPWCQWYKLFVTLTMTANWYLADTWCQIVHRWFYWFTTRIHSIIILPNSICMKFQLQTFASFSVSPAQNGIANPSLGVLLPSNHEMVRPQGPHRALTL